jgi:hypothetical protein
MNCDNDSPYSRGSYNNTEVEALYYGTHPILHSTTRQTILPQDVYSTVDNITDLPETVHNVVQNYRGRSEEIRKERARQFVYDTHYGPEKYLEMRSLLFPNG